MIVKFIFLVFILYLVFIYNKLQKNKFYNLDLYVKKASETIQQLETENEFLRINNNKFENSILEKNIEIKNLQDENQNKNSKLYTLTQNSDSHENFFQNFNSIFEESEKKLYEQISEYKYDLQQKNELVSKLESEKVSLNKEVELIYKYLKINDYALYEEFLKNK
jgi:hypothetical protein